jgi:hypothetical protein
VLLHALKWHKNSWKNRAFGSPPLEALGGSVVVARFLRRGKENEVIHKHSLTLSSTMRRAPASISTSPVASTGRSRRARVVGIPHLGELLFVQPRARIGQIGVHQVPFLLHMAWAHERVTYLVCER